MPFFVGPLIPLFWTSGDICPGIQSQGGLTCTLSCLGAVPQIHLWCDTCQPLDGQHGSLLCSLYADLSRGRMPGFEQVISQTRYPLGHRDLAALQ